MVFVEKKLEFPNSEILQMNDPVGLIFRGQWGQPCLGACTVMGSKTGVILASVLTWGGWHSSHNFPGQHCEHPEQRGGMGRARRARGSHGDRARDVREDVSEAALSEPFRSSLLKGWEWSRMGKLPIRQEKACAKGLWHKGLPGVWGSGGQPR